MSGGLMKLKREINKKYREKMTALLLGILMLLTGCRNNGGSGTGSSPSQSNRDPVTGEYAPMENASVLTGIFRSGETYRCDSERLSVTTLPLYDAESGKLTTFSTYEEEIPVTDENGNPLYIIPGLQKIEYRSVTTLRTLLPNGECVAAIPLTIPEDHVFHHGGIAENRVWYITYNAAAGSLDEYGFTLNLMNLDGSDYRSVPAVELFGNVPDNDGMFKLKAGVLPDGSMIVSTGYELAVLDPVMSRLYSVIAEDEITAISVLPGSVCLFVTGEINEQKLWKLADGDHQSVLCADVSGLMVRVLFGPGADYYLLDNQGIHAVTGKESVLLLDRQNTALSSGIYVIGAVAPDVFAVHDSDDAANSGAITLYRRADNIDLSTVKVIEVACALPNEDSSLQQMVIKYNSEHPDRRVVLTDAVDRDTEYGTWYDRLCFNLANGFYKPDIVIAQNGKKTIDVLIAKNLYRDLTPFLEKDQEIRLNDLFGMVRSYFKDENGGLWGISPNFYLRTLTGRNDILGKYGNHDSWTLDEALDFLESKSGKTVGLDRLTQENWSWWLLGPTGFNRWINYDTSTCNFDNGDFVRLLRYLNTLPKDFDDYMRHADFWAGMSAVERDYDYTPYQEGIISLVSAWLEGIPSCYTLGEKFGTEDGDATLSYIGFPTENGSDTFELRSESVCMITQFCSDPDVAWDFIRTLFDDPNSQGDTKEKVAAVFSMHLFPSLKTTYDSYSDVFDKYYMTESVKQGNSSLQFSDNYKERPKDGSDPIALNGEKVIVYDRVFLEEVRSMLDSASVTSYVNYTPAEIEDIIFEEVSAYLGGGSNADQCVKYIQSRVGIWLAEHK